MPWVVQATALATVKGRIDVLKISYRANMKHASSLRGCILSTSREFWHFSLIFCTIIVILFIVKNGASYTVCFFMLRTQWNFTDTIASLSQFLSKAWTSWSDAFISEDLTRPTPPCICTVTCNCTQLELT